MDEFHLKNVDQVLKIAVDLYYKYLKKNYYILLESELALTLGVLWPNYIQSLLADFNDNTYFEKQISQYMINCQLILMFDLFFVSRK